MGKAKRERKKALREGKKEAVEAERAARAAAERRLKLMHRVLAVLPVLFVAAVLTAYFGFEDRKMAGLIGFVGVAVWVPLLLGTIGGSVAPKDKLRAGSIDFGSKR